MRARKHQESSGKVARGNLRAGILWAACVACAMAVAGGAAFARHSAERGPAGRALAPAAADAQPLENDPITVDENVRMKTRDGVALNADIYRPNLPGKFPVLMTRTPYMKNDSGQVAQAVHMASRGYVVVVQDTRGRYASGGDWYTFKNESNDGYDAVEWAAALPQSDGRVGMFGGSYVGATQWLAAI
ncbi:MAG: CocE/NonD family hydrolase, partial [Candidatus Acidiferrales bacterium]